MEIKAVSASAFAKLKSVRRKTFLPRGSMSLAGVDIRYICHIIFCKLYIFNGKAEYEVYTLLHCQLKKKKRFVSQLCQ